jgi:hypothetical protein
MDTNIERATMSAIRHAARVLGWANGEAYHPQSQFILSGYQLGALWIAAQKSLLASIERGESAPPTTSDVAASPEVDQLIEDILKTGEQVWVQKKQRKLEILGRINMLFRERVEHR